MNKILSIQVQDSETGEWETITNPEDMRGFNIGTTPVGFIVENYRAGNSEIIIPFEIPPQKIITLVIYDAW